MLWRRVCLVVALSHLAGACAYNDHFDNRVYRYDIAAEQARDTMILTNIIRASHAEPMSFVQLGQVTGSNTSSAQVGLPSLLLGPLAPAAGTTVLQNALQKDVIFGASAGGGNGYVGNSASTSGSTNFAVTPSETKDFYLGLLSEVDPLTLEGFIQQGMSRELLFYLFTDKLIDERNGIRTELRNDPLSSDFPKFERYVSLAMDYGLSSEPVPSQRSGRSNRNSNKPDDQSKTQDKERKWQICFDKTYMKQGIKANNVAPVCGSSKVSEDGRTVTYVGLQGEPVKLTVLPRSTFAIFQFLGRILAAGDKGRIMLYSQEAIDQSPLRDEFLFSVETNASGSCFLEVDYEGESYCVPMDGARNTKRILSLLTQLLALNTSISDIPVTPTVQILQ
jgi:hypothetical protein